MLELSWISWLMLMVLMFAAGGVAVLFWLDIDPVCEDVEEPIWREPEAFNTDSEMDLLIEQGHEQLMINKEIYKNHLARMANKAKARANNE